MGPQKELITSLSQWVIVVLGLGVVLGYFVHWLLVFTDYREYQHCGGQLDVLRFRRIRELIKSEYRRQRCLAANRQPHKPVAPTLGEQVLRTEHMNLFANKT